MTVDAELLGPSGGCRDGHRQPPTQRLLSGHLRRPCVLYRGCPVLFSPLTTSEAPHPRHCLQWARGCDSLLRPRLMSGCGRIRAPPGPLTLLAPDSTLRGAVTGPSVPGTSLAFITEVAAVNRNLLRGGQMRCCPLVSKRRSWWEPCQRDGAHSRKHTGPQASQGSHMRFQPPESLDYLILSFKTARHIYS